MRYSSLLRSAFCGAAFMGAVLAATPSAMSAVYSAQKALAADTIQQFLADPAALLTQYPTGGPQMITRVRDLAASNPATVDALLGLLTTANPDQASAIGTALGHVALMAVSNDQPFVTDLKTKVAQSGNVSAITAFSAVVGGDIKLTAATSTIGGAGGGGEAQTGGGNASTMGAVGGAFNLTTATGNVPDSFSIVSFGSGGAGYQGSSGSVSMH